jgi:hypothetical protein
MTRLSHALRANVLALREYWHAIQALLKAIEQHGSNHQCHDPRFVNSPEYRQWREQALIQRAKRFGIH